MPIDWDISHNGVSIDVSDGMVQELKPGEMVCPRCGIEVTHLVVHFGSQEYQLFPCTEVFDPHRGGWLLQVKEEKIIKRTYTLTKQGED